MLTNVRSGNRLLHKYITAALDLHAPYPAEWVRREVLRLFGDEIYTGWVVHTTIRTDLQAAAQQSLKEGLHLYDNRYGYRGVEKHLIVKLKADPIQLGEVASRFSSVGFLLPAVVSKSFGTIY